MGGLLLTLYSHLFGNITFQSLPSLSFQFTHPINLSPICLQNLPSISVHYVYISHRHISSVSADWVKLAALCSLWITAYFWLTFLVTKIRKTSTTQTLLRKTSGESPMPNYVITLFFSLKHLIKPVKFSLLARILILQNGSAVQEV